MPKEPRMKFFFPPYFFFASALKSPTLICSTLRHDARCVFRCRHGVWRFIFIFHFSSLLHTPSSSSSSSCMCMRGAQSSDGSSSSSTGNSLCSLGGLIFFLHIFLLSFTSSQRAARQMTSCVIYKGMMTSANDERVDGVRNLINKRATAEEAVALFSLHFFFSFFSLISHRISPFLSLRAGLSRNVVAVAAALVDVRHETHSRDDDVLPQSHAMKTL